MIAFARLVLNGGRKQRAASVGGVLGTDTLANLSLDDALPVANRLGLTHGQSVETPADGGSAADGWCGDEVMATLAERAAVRGIVLPGYRTRDEFAAAVERCKAAFLSQAVAAGGGFATMPTPATILPTPSEPVATPAQPEQFQEMKLLPELTPDAAASQFLAWLRASFGPETQRVYDSDELGAAYAEFCARIGREPTPENHMRSALALMPGISKKRESGKCGSKRIRSWLWTIRAASVSPSVSGETGRKTERGETKLVRAA